MVQANWRLTMLRISWTLAVALAATTAVMLGAGRAAADDLACPPPVSYYTAPPTVTYYGPPPLYHPLQRLSYYLAPPVLTVTAPPAPAVYPAPAAAATTTRYGLFGRPWVSTTYYYPR